MRVTATYAIAATVIETVLGVGIALLLNRSSIIGKIFEKVLILPLMIAPVIAGVIWKLMFNPQFGVLNYVLGLGSDVRLADQGPGAVVVGPGRRLDLHPVRGDPGAGRHPVAAPGALRGLRCRRRQLVVHVPPADAADDVALHPGRGHLPVHGLPEDVRLDLRAHRGRARRGHPHACRSAPTRTRSSFQNYSRGSTYMFLLWVLVFITARYLVKRARQGPAARGRSGGLTMAELMPGQKRLTPGRGRRRPRC